MAQISLRSILALDPYLFLRNNPLLFTIIIYSILNVINSYLIQSEAHSRDTEATEQKENSHGKLRTNHERTSPVPLPDELINSNLSGFNANLEKSLSPQAPASNKPGLEPLRANFLLLNENQDPTGLKGLSKPKPLVTASTPHACHGQGMSISG
jgi:hypothetical protein